MTRGSKGRARERKQRKRGPLLEPNYFDPSTHLYRPPKATTSVPQIPPLLPLLSPPSSPHRSRRSDGDLSPAPIRVRAAMTMMVGDRGLNGSAKEALKQAILQHELIFRSQVRELHRLYWTQKNLTRELFQKAAPASAWRTDVLAKCEGKPRDQRTFNLLLGEYVRDDREETVSVGIKLAAGSEMAELNCSGGEANDEKGDFTRSLVGRAGCLNEQGVIDLEESSEARNAVSFFGFRVPINSNRDACGSRPTIPSESVLSSRTWNGTGLVLSEHNLHVGCSDKWREQKQDKSGSALEDSTHGPSIDMSTKKQISTARKILHIDLNIAQDDDSNVLNDSLMAFPSPSMSLSVFHHGVLQRESSNKCSKETITHQPAYTCTSSSISGEKNAHWLFHGCQDLHPCSTQASAPSTKVIENSQRHEDEAINKVHKPDSKDRTKCYRITAEEFYSDVDGEFQNSVNRIDTSGLCKLGEENAGSSSGQPFSCLHSDSKKQASIVTFSNDTNCNNRHASVGSTNLPLTVTRNSDDKQANCDGSEEDTVSSHVVTQCKDQQGGIVEEVPVVKKSNLTTGKRDSSAVDKSAERGVHSISNNSRTTRLDLFSAESFPSKQAPFPETCDQVHLLDMSCHTGKPDPQAYPEQQQAQAVEMDCMIAKAAETLVSLSLEKPARPSDLVASVGLTELEHEETNDQPQYSSDSFESITLKLSEIKDAEFLIPARSTDKREGEDACGVKLRRGRGLRDFQKDVLPGLVSLSRHEIREDMHTIGYELRKRKPRQAGRDYWSVPVSNRRSRLYSVSRRR